MYDSRIELLLNEINALIANDFFKKGLKGRKGLRSSVKSDAHPLLRYVHRMIEFYSGINACMPMTTQFHLQSFVDNVLGQKYKDENRLTVYLLRDGVEELYHLLDNHAKELCVYFGLDKNRASKIWNKAFNG